MKKNLSETFVGKAVNAKTGACLIDDEKTVYQIEGLQEWKERFLNKRLAVKGLLIITEQEEALQNEKGEYKAGVTGNINIITKAVLPDTEKSIALVVVFKKEIAEKSTKTIMQNCGYPFSKGMDSSRGKNYFYKTGEKYILLFPLEKDRTDFFENYKEKPEIYEIYKPDWNICKD